MSGNTAMDNTWSAFLIWGGLLQMCTTDNRDYYIVASKKTWVQAQRFCRTFLTDLACIRNESELRYISHLTKNATWIGLRKDQFCDSSTLQCSNGENSDILQSNKTRTGDCVLVWLDKWEWKDCNDSHQFICYKESYSGSTDNTSCETTLAGNIAFKGTASESSKYAYGDPNNAIDGCKATNFSFHSCSHTRNDSASWWMLDLKRDFNICAVAVTNRGDCCSQRIIESQIHIGNGQENHGTLNPSCGTISSLSAGATIMFDCSVMEGQFVTINIPGRAEYLTLCEVQVLQCPPLTSGQTLDVVLSPGNNVNQANCSVEQSTFEQTTEHTTQPMTTATQNITTTQKTVSIQNIITAQNTTTQNIIATQDTITTEVDIKLSTSESTGWSNLVTKGNFFEVHLIKEKRTWKQALLYCHNSYGCLVTVTSDDIQKAVEAIVNNASTSGVWIGLHKHWLQDQWMWTNGEPYKYNKWNKGEPNNPATERCGMMYANNYTWNDECCFRHLNFICV